MPLESGTNLGPYEIVAPIGAGGMGEVYKARDTRLDRTVAIKVLPEHLSENAELRKRFEQEARAVSSLNHPNICTLHDVGHENGIDFLVMELIEGESLADRLEKGPLPPEQALTYGIQICEGLDKAHQNGIVHRDLKPGNIILTKSGPKLLDFGLAKLQPTSTEPDLSAVTQQKPLTQKGAILGTFQYMAPEQLEGGEADARTDIFALGAVLYEMITGKKAFEGKSQASLIHAIMGVDPAPVSTIVTTSPPALDHVIRSCLAKDPDDRSQSAGEVARNLRWIRDQGPEAMAPTTRPAFSKWERVAWAAALLVTALGVWTWMRPAPSRVVRMTITPPSTAPLEITNSHQDVAFTPDGTHIIYTATPERMLYVRPLDQLEARPLTNTRSGRSPFVSPDGAWVGFMNNADDTLQKVSIEGGPALTICKVTQTPRGASWGDDDTIVFANSLDSGLSIVSAAGGSAEPLTTPEEGVSHRFPEFLPGARGVLFTIVSNEDVGTAQIAVLDRRNGEHKTLAQGVSARYITTGHIVYILGETLLAQPFDLRSLSVSGSPVPVLEGVMTKTNAAGNFGLSRDGSLVYAPSGQSGGGRVLTWDYRNGDQKPVSTPPGGYIRPRLSPDGSRVAFLDIIDEMDIWIWDFERETKTRLTFDPAPDTLPIWTPDGERIIFYSRRDGTEGLYTRAADGTGAVERVTEGFAIAETISPDGKLLVMTRENAEGGQLDLHVLSLDEGGRTEPFVSDDGNQRDASISPDGRWLAYVSNESGGYQVYVRPFPNTDTGKWMISTGGGRYPTWAPDGRTVFYYEPSTASLVGVAVSTDPTFTPGRSQPVPYEPNNFSLERNYDIHPDGDRFLSLRDAALQASERHLVVVLNWAEELKRRLP